MDLTEIARLMEANLLQVFNERDPARRREVIAHTYTADVRWTDDDGTTVDHDALNTKAQQLQDGPLTGLVFVKKGVVYGTTGLGFLAFDLIADGEDTPVLSSFDVAAIKDHRISELWTVLTMPQPEGRTANSTASETPAPHTPTNVGDTVTDNTVPHEKNPSQTRRG